MALQVFTDLMALVWQHPFLSGLVLVLFTPPFFPIVKFFSPLLISTALFMLALFTMGPRSSDATPSEAEGEDWEFRRTADVKVWEDKTVVDGERSSKRRNADGSWMDWVKGIEESSLSWMETKLKNENWKGSVLNDDNVSILQETSWAKIDPSTSETVASYSRLNEEINPAVIAPSELFKVDSGLKEATLRISEFDLGEDARGDVDDDADAPALEDVIEEPHQQPDKLRVNSSVHHEPLVNLQIPVKGDEILMATTDSPSTDLDSAPDLDRSKRFLFATVKRGSMNANSGASVESDIDTPDALMTLSKSGKLKQIENLGDMIEDVVQAEKSGEDLPSLGVLKPTTAEQVEDVKDKLEGFITEGDESSSSHGAHPVVVVVPVAKSKSPGSPLFKDRKEAVTSTKKSRDDSSSSSGEEQLTDSDSDSEFEIFPPVDPAKIKLHPPVKLDIQQLEKKLGTSLSQRTRATPAKTGEITEVQ